MLFQTPVMAGTASGNLVTPTRIEQTPVSYLFFHPANVDALHTSIRYHVHQRTNVVIDRQGDYQLRLIMAAIYQDSQHPTLESAFAESATHRIVQGLNARVVNKAVHEIIASLHMHNHYINDIASPVPVPMERSAYSNQRARQKSLEFPIGF